MINDGQSAGHSLRLDELSLQTSEVLILGWAKWYHFNELAIRALMESNMAVLDALPSASIVLGSTSILSADFSNAMALIGL